MESRTDTVSEVIDLRVQVYGDPKVTFQQIATMWSGYLGIEVKATDVPMLLMQVKMVRAKQMPNYSDNSDDIEGYLDIFRQLVGDEMVHARTVNDFIALYEERRNATVSALLES